MGGLWPCLLDVGLIALLTVLLTETDGRLEDDVGMSCCLESSLPGTCRSVTQRQQKHFPEFLDLPPTLPETSAPKALLGTAACLPVCQSFVLYIYFSGGRTGIRRHPRQQLGCFFLPFLHVKVEKGRTAGESVFLRESLSCSPSRHTFLEGMADRHGAGKPGGL